jgi:hypothetical protein
LRHENAGEKSQHRRDVTQRLRPVILSREDAEQDDIAGLGVSEHVPVGDPGKGVEKAATCTEQRSETQQALHLDRPKSESRGAADLHPSPLPQGGREGARLDPGITGEGVRTAE